MKRRSFLLSTTLFLSSCASKVKRSPSSTLFDIFRSKPQGLSSNDFDQIEDYYDLICIGSGYGSSVIAARMSEEYPNSKICVLERGKEFFPGDFPKSFANVLGEMHSKANPLGLLSQNLGAEEDCDLDIIGANGLGGTSLINAAISIAPTKEVFLQKEWPKEIRESASKGPDHTLGELGKYYSRADKELGASYQEDQLSKTKKSIAFKKAFEKAKVKLSFLKLNINYKSNIKSDRNDCTLCGDCCSGCNVGAKNILPYNYLYKAKESGCSIFTETEVIDLYKTKSGYRIEIKSSSNLNFDKKIINAKNIVLGAGSLGSTKLLLKARKNGIRLSQKIGESLSLNADVLGFCYNGHEKTQSVGTGVNKRLQLVQGSVGTGISTVANFRDLNKERALEEQFLLLEGAIPSPLASTLAYGLSMFAKANKKDFNFSTEQWDRVERDSNITNNFGKFEQDGALNYSTLFLACGHDSSGGKYILTENDEIKVIYPDIVKEYFYKNITSHMKEVSKKLGGHYLDNPRTSIFKDKMMATHPLGGCPMGDDATKGVVNHKGQVFNGRTGIHKGLYVVDASIIPRSLGATPLLTISALAERISEKMIEDNII
ncbi:GMC family oxidoreductase N-terminal domain-containing protein [Halobacteriovorax sp. GB3]|uniref:GMC oxidoreductase n=1 Tax=Halobacteriovorax sp. GB3 TaxID=2719615 RepID=UPI002360383E|nr:GMC oxidoreductase [Halobacteriovorax sp. GB3]MDD0852038.1 GMC family oxidoreductase N-terminal domain-containing protein [Halobacteriovorax sp. GB3]